MSMQQNSGNREEYYDLTVIGSGMAGLAASLFAANRSLSVLQAGSTGGIIFSTGLLDLMAVHPCIERRIWENPWEAIDSLTKADPGHPYAKIKKEDIRASIDEIMAFFNENAFQYRFNDFLNTRVITAMGTAKHTYCVPRSMWANADALEKKEPCLIVGFSGLKEFSAKQIVATLGKTWPGLRSGHLVFPDTENKNDIFSVHLAQALELHETRTRLADLIKPLIKDAKYVGLPAILGIKKTGEILDELEKAIGVPVFEIPTMPASVPGIRLKEFFDTHLQSKGINCLIQKRVKNVDASSDRNFTISFEDSGLIIRTRGIILATGRFMGKGLIADRERIREAIFDLPVYQPENRAEWHKKDFFDPAGHPVNRAGIEVDDFFRPLSAQGRHFHPWLFAAGSILAHQDWMRMKCGSGLAIATAYAAVNSFYKLKG